MNSRFDRCESRRTRMLVLAEALLFVMLGAPVAIAAAPDGLSLPEAVRIASARAPLLEARRFSVVAAREDAARATSLPDPRLTVGIDNLPVTGSDAFDANADEMTMKKIGLWQDIPSRAKRDARRSLADRQIDDALARAGADEVQLRRVTAEAWIEAWSARREAAALRMLRDEAALAANLSKARVEGGAGSVSDALAAQAAVLEVDNRIEAAQAREAAAQVELARWVGDAMTDTSEAAPDFNSLPISEATLLAAADTVGPVLPANAYVETAAAAVDLARADKHPDWSVGASYGQRADGRSDMIMFEVGIGLPLFPGNRQDRNVAARKADYEAALALREDARREQRARIRADLARWEALKRQVALHEDSLLPLAQDRSATALAAYRAGGPLQPWLDARRDELGFHLAHTEHLGELGRAWAALAFLVPTETQP